MWTILALLLLFFGGMLAFSLGERFYFCKVGKFSLPKLDFFSAAFLCLSIVVGGTCLYGNSSHLPVYTWIVILSLLWGLFYFSQAKWPAFRKTLFQLGMCFLGVFGILMPLPVENLCYYLIGFILVFFWFIGWRLISYFNRYPMTTYMVSSGWCIGLILIYSIFNYFSPEISLFAAVLGISVYVICRKRLSYGILNLDPCTADIAGFIWAGIWTLCLLRMNLSILILIYGYYLMELCVLLIQYFKKKPLETLFVRALFDDKRRKKAISLVLFHIIAMTFFALSLAVTSDSFSITVSVSLVLAFVVCFNLYNHLDNLDRPIGTWRDIFSMLKGGICTFPQVLKNIGKEVKTGLKTQKRKKKTSRKKLAGKKKGIKKKK